MNQKDLIKIKNGRTIAPEMVELHVTNLCNHECKWCIYREINDDKKSVMKKEQAIRLIDELSEVNCKGIVFSGGGDPLTYPHILEVIEYASAKGLMCSLITNGGMFETIDLERLIRSVTLMRISIDAYDEESYKSIHSPKNSEDTFERLCNNIKKLANMSERKCKLILTYILDEKSVNYVEKFYKIAIALNVDGIDIKTEHSISYVKKQVLRDTAREQLSKHGMDKIKVSFDLVKRRNKFAIGKWVKLCYQCVIEPDGEVYPCCHTIKPEFLIGNINETGFFDIWYGETYKNLIRNFYAMNQGCSICADSSDAKIVKRIIKSMEKV